MLSASVRTRLVTGQADQRRSSADVSKAENRWIAQRPSGEISIVVRARSASVGRDALEAGAVESERGKGNAGLGCRARP